MYGHYPIVQCIHYNHVGWHAHACFMWEWDDDGDLNHMNIYSTQPSFPILLTCYFHHSIWTLVCFLFYGVVTSYVMEGWLLSNTLLNFKYN